MIIRFLTLLLSAGILLCDLRCAMAFPINLHLQCRSVATQRYYDPLDRYRRRSRYFNHTISYENAYRMYTHSKSGVQMQLHATSLKEDAQRVWNKAKTMAKKTRQTVTSPARRVWKGVRLIVRPEQKIRREYQPKILESWTSAEPSTRQGNNGDDAVLEIDNGDSTSSVVNPAFKMNRSAVAASGVDLSGTWDLVVNDDFKKEYDRYLMLLGQPIFVRSVATNIVVMTSEETVQSEQGRSLLIRGRNVRGTWERTLIASGMDPDMPPLIDGGNTTLLFEPVLTPVVTADEEQVLAEAWWEEDGTIHRSWMRGIQKYGGGDFESKRYLQDDGKTLICETVFHPADDTREKAKVTWRFARHQGHTFV